MTKRLNWKVAAAAGTVIGGGFGGFVFADDDGPPLVPDGVQLESTPGGMMSPGAPVDPTPATSTTLIAQSTITSVPSPTVPDTTTTTVPADTAPPDTTSVASVASPVSPASPVSAASPVSPDTASVASVASPVSPVSVESPEDVDS